MIDILIAAASNDCRRAASRVLDPGKFNVITAKSIDKAFEVMATVRPDIILADCDLENNPLIWVDKINELDLYAQVLAVTDQPNFDKALDWVSAGVYNVLSKPLDESRLGRLINSVAEHMDAFQIVAQAASNGRLCESEWLNQALTDFYHGLAGILESYELKDYIIQSVKNLTGACRVKLDLVDELRDSLSCSDSVFFNDDDDSESAAYNAASPVKSAEASWITNCRLGFDLSSQKQHFGNIYLYFDNKSDLKIRRRETIMEIIAACGSAMGSALKYSKATTMAARDGLTGLYNRRIFNDALKQEFARAERHNQSLSLLSLDLDHFKAVNDNYGHQTGDMVLKEIAAIIAKVARSTDLPARIGGEEFAVILPHTTQEQARALAKRLKNMLDNHFISVGDTILKQTVSQGVAGLEHFMVKTPEDMVYWADQALYLAKREGRDTIRTVADLPVTTIMKDGAYAFQ